MPFVTSRVNVPISAEQETDLKSRIGKAIELIPGKSEAYLLLSFEDNCRLWLRGDNKAPIAYIETNVFGNEDHSGFEHFAYAVTEAFSAILHIPPENVYIKFDDIKVWSVSGMAFDRSRFR